jgi:hypothetical protein
MPEQRLTPRDLLSDQQVPLIERQWADTDVLLLSLPGAAHSVYAMWETGTHRLRCWYIDLQEPLRRTPLGFDTMDHLLDIVVSPDRSEWRWKDEEELGEATAIGLYTQQQASSIRVEGQRAVAMLKASDSPYSRAWADWSAPRDWAIATLPQEWDALADA